MSSQTPQGGGLLPPNIMSSLDELIDRINQGSSSSNFPIISLLVGTNEGIPLSRSYGTTYHPLQSNISDEVLSSIETVWATLPSATPPHVKNALYLRNNNGDEGKSAAMEKDGIQLKKLEPPHPLLSSLGLGDQVKTTMAFYDHVTLIHIHLAPIVVTILASPDPTTNIGAIKSVAVPFLNDLLTPARSVMTDICYGILNGGPLAP